MKLNWPYKILLFSAFLTGVAFAGSPYMVTHSLSKALQQNDDEKWRSLVNTAYFKQYTTKLMDGLLRVKMEIDSKNPDIGRGMAMQDFTFARGAVDRKSNKMISTKGFGHLLCGEVARFPDFPLQHDIECWVMDGQLHWQSLTRIELSYKNPQSGWLTHLYLERSGLFNWQLVDIALPVDDMVKQLEKQLQTNA